jgi:hypothetical protein
MQISVGPRLRESVGLCFKEIKRVLGHNLVIVVVSMGTVAKETITAKDQIATLGLVHNELASS